MRKMPLFAVLLIGIVSAQAQNSSFYLGLSSYLSSKYTDASEQFSTSVETAEPKHKTDIFYLDGLCQYFLHNYALSLSELDSALIYQKKYPKDAVYFSRDDLHRYQAMNYEKLGDRDKEILVLKKMVATNKNKWAMDRLKTPRLSKK